jgi:hypothetical protein
MTARHRLLHAIPPLVGAAATYILMRLTWLAERLPHTMHWE